MERKKYFFGEGVSWLEDSEKEEVTQYLVSWKKFLLRKLNKDCMKVKVVDEQWICRDPMYNGLLAQYGSMALKLAIEIEFQFEIEPFGST